MVGVNHLQVTEPEPGLTAPRGRATLHARSRTLKFYVIFHLLGSSFKAVQGSFLTLALVFKAGFLLSKVRDRPSDVPLLPRAGVTTGGRPCVPKESIGRS